MFKWLSNFFSSAPAEIKPVVVDVVEEVQKAVLDEKVVAEAPAKEKRPSVSKRKKTDAVTPTENLPKPSPRVAALKSSDAVKSGVQSTAIPNKTALLAMTKDVIESTAREYNIELDKRMTKANMVADFHAKAKAAAKTATE